MPPEVLSLPLHAHSGRPSALARAALRLLGWKVQAPGLPAKQGVIFVYPHTSNWDFVLGILAKWAVGLDLRFWGKDSLFRMPLMGRWMRYLGGVGVDRTNSHGIVADTVRQMRLAREHGERFWLAVAPEGTRSLSTGWRTGAYQVALQTGVPVGLCYLDFPSRTVAVTHFIRLSGQPEADFAAFAAHLGHRVGKRPALASPIRPRS